MIETLRFAAQLRLPEVFTSTQREDRVEEVIALMGIGHRRDVVVGNTRVKGISGGERKRLCIAIELLSKPKLLFLDEPTSGLDSSTSLAVMTALKELSDLGECTVVCTIHQPQEKIFFLFDNLILMKSGDIVYQGSCRKSLRFLETLGMPCPQGTNPADHLLEVISPKDKDAPEPEKLVVPVNLGLGFEKGIMKHISTSWHRQCYTLTRRNFLQYWRRRELIFLNFVATLIIAFFIGCGIWHQQGSDQVSVTTLPPSLFFGCVTQGIFASLQTVNSFPAERAIMLRERSAGSYYVSAYFIAKTVVDMVTQLWPPILFSVIVYPLMGFQPIASKFFIYMFFMILDNMAATSVAVAGLCVCCACACICTASCIDHRIASSRHYVATAQCTHC